MPHVGVGKVHDLACGGRYEWGSIAAAADAAAVRSLHSTAVL